MIQELNDGLLLLDVMKKMVSTSHQILLGDKIRVGHVAHVGCDKWIHFQENGKSEIHITNLNI
jgi:hypothetical protein